MSYNQKQIKTDVNDKPVPQYFNKDLQDFEVLEGQSGASKVITYDSSGNESNVNVAVQPILDKLSQLTGTVIDEEIRKDNEQDRVQLYNDLLVELDRIAQITEQVPQSVLDRVSNLSDKIGQLQELDTAEKTNIVLALNEIYQDLVAHKAEKATDIVRPHGLGRIASKDYEEGIWTPVLYGANVSGLEYVRQEGRYIKIGNKVWVWVDVKLADNISEQPMSPTQIDGLPYVSSNSSYASTNVRTNGIVLPDNAVNVLFITFYQSSLNLSIQTRDGWVEFYAKNYFVSNFEIRGSLEYTI